MWVQPTVNRDSVLCWRSNHYPALLLSRFPLWSVKIFRIIHIILPIAFFYKGSANLRECEGKCSSWFLFTLKTIFQQSQKKERSFLIFLVYIKLSRLNSVMFMGEQFQKKPFMWSRFKEIKKYLTPQNYVHRTQTC